MEHCAIYFIPVRLERGNLGEPTSRVDDVQILGRHFPEPERVVLRAMRVPCGDLLAESEPLFQRVAQVVDLLDDPILSFVRTWRSYRLHG